MPLRRRLTLVTAAAVGVAVLLAAAVSYLAVRGELRGQADDALRQQAGLIRTLRDDDDGLRGGLAPRRLPAPPPREGGSASYAQVIGAQGGVRRITEGDVVLPVDAEDRALARGASGERLEDREVDGEHLRVLTASLPGGGAVQLARSLEGTDAVLSRLRITLLLLCAGGIGLAVFLGRLASRNLVAPIRSVAEAARHIGETEDLGRRIEVRGNDEVAELASRFNAMLDTLQASRAALDRSVSSQRQLVADASHELRTPVTSLRTNIEVLMEPGRLAEDERRALLADLVEQTEELTALVGDLIELARGDERSPVLEDVRLDELAEEAVARARRHAPGVRFETRLAPMTVTGTPARLDRAVTNLLDNAAKHSPPGGVVEVEVDHEGVHVRDHGSGIDPAEVGHLFDRFYRGAAARGRAGTGLGLAIVRQVAEQHDGAASAGNAPGGGAVFTLRLPRARAALGAAPVDAAGKPVAAP